MYRPHDDGSRSTRERALRLIARVLGGVLRGACLVALAPNAGRAQCEIQGISAVDENQSFTLCGPRGSSYSYRWAGPGVPGTRARCITIPGRSSGLYEYTLAIDVNGVERDRCTFVVTVEGDHGSAATGPDVCEIVGPSEFDRGTTVELCGVPSRFDTRSYAWTGPAGFRADTRCVQVARAGTYVLATRNEITGHERRCTHRLVESASASQDCVIRGADTIREGERVRLCGPSSGGYGYRWTGPAGFTATATCVDVARAGTYTLTLRDRAGRIVECTHTLDEDYQGPDDSDQPDYDNCPRASAWWSRALADRNELSVTEVRNLARCVDTRSAAFGWSNAAQGLAQALNPPAPMTRRKRATQQLATLLANLCAREQGITAANGQVIGLDADTPISLRSASTVGELAALIDRMLKRGRGNFADVNRIASAVNRGQGIGGTCE